jgi:small subunit ribosomal protein S16
MVKIRLKRVGKRKQPSYRVVVADARSPRDGRNIESIGSYDPRREPSVVDIDNERAVYWLRRGAQPSGPVARLLRISGAWSMYTGEPAPETAAPARRAAPASVTVAEDTGDVPAEAVEQTGPAPEAQGGGEGRA